MSRLDNLLQQLVLLDSIESTLDEMLELDSLAEYVTEYTPQEKVQIHNIQDRASQILDNIHRKMKQLGLN